MVYSVSKCLLPRHPEASRFRKVFSGARPLRMQWPIFAWKVLLPLPMYGSSWNNSFRVSSAKSNW